VKDDLGLKTPGVYSIPCECGQVYIGQTGRSIDTRIKEHHRHIRLAHPDKSAVGEHSISRGHPRHQDPIHQIQIYGPANQRGHWDRATSEQHEQVLAGHGNYLSTPLKYVETPRLGVSCFICPSQDNSARPLDPSSLTITYWHHPGSHWGPSKGRILSYLTTPHSLFTMHRHPICRWPGPWHYPSHSHAIGLPLSFFYFGPPIQLPFARFLAYRLSFPIGQPSPVDSYITAILAR
jgi:hypothetical protein